MSILISVVESLRFRAGLLVLYNTFTRKITYFVETLDYNGFKYEDDCLLGCCDM
jgi:hypothetical protein